MLKLLRPSRSAELISAQAFDEQFVRHIEQCCELQQVPLLAWCEAILGPADAPFPQAQAAAHFARTTADYDFLCPSYEGIALAPRLLALRNLAGAPIRLLLIAHAPGGYVLEWTLLRPLLRPGDLIVAPTEQARATICFLCPELASFLHVIPHPLAPLPAVAPAGGQRLVSLGRIEPGKLLHRQLEALALLRERGLHLPMQVAGPLTHPGQEGPHPYARSLLTKIRRLDLTDQVQLVGTIHGEAAKAAFLSGASLLLNLSVTVEESFGKSVVEALSLGVPVLVTRWNGLPETVGSGGATLPVHESEGGWGVDVSPHELADAIQNLLTAPPSPAACRAEASRSDPARVVPRYGAMLQAARMVGRQPLPEPLPTGRAAPSGGLLGRTAPLTALSWPDLFLYYQEMSDHLRLQWAGTPPPGRSVGEQLHAVLLAGTRRPLERFLAGLAAEDEGDEASTPRLAPTGDWVERVLGAAMAPATLSSRQVCLALGGEMGRVEALRAGVAHLRAAGAQTPGLTYLAIEVERQSGQMEAAIALCLAEEATRPWGEGAAARLRHLARLCREGGQPERALPWLRRWLLQFPDGPDAGGVWIDCCVNALRATPPLLAEAHAALEQARTLLGPSPIFARVEGECLRKTLLG